MTLSYTRRLHLAVPDFLSEPWHAEFAAAMDSIDYAIFAGMVSAGAELWVNVHDYVTGDIVIDPETGTLYVSSEDHTSSTSLTFTEERAAFPDRWTSFAVDVATQAEAEAGFENTKYMTPLRVAQAIDAQSPTPGIATQIDAEEGTSNEVMMTPLRTTQNVNARIANQAQAEAGTDNITLMTPLRVAQAIDTIGLPGGAQIAFSAHKNATNQTGIPGSGVQTKITFGTELYDLGSHYDTANSRWTPPAGNCHIDAGVYVQGVSAGSATSLILFKNGALFKQTTTFTGGTDVGLQLSADDVGNSSDYYELYISTSAAGPITILGTSSNTFFTGHFLGETSAVTLGVAEIGFRAYASGGVAQPTGVWTKLSCPIEAYDQGGYYNAGLSRWTPPTGMVHIDAGFYQTGSQQYHVAIAKNGNITWNSASRSHTSEGSCEISINDLASGADYYEIWQHQSQGGTVFPTVQYVAFQGYRVGIGPTGATGATGPTGAAGVDGTLITTLPAPPQGRLTLVSNTPVMASTVADAVAIFYTPYVGSRIPIYTGTVFDMMDFVELSTLLNDTVRNPFAIGASKVNDWFVWKRGVDLVLSHGPNWSVDTARPPGLSLTRVKGFWLNTEQIGDGSLTGPAPLRGTYVGTTRSSATSTINWRYGTNAVGGGSAEHGVWNCYNRIDVIGAVKDATGNWAVPPGMRNLNGSTNNAARAVFGLAEDGLIGSTQYVCQPEIPSGGWMAAGVSLDTITVGDHPGGTYAGVHATYDPQTGYTSTYTSVVGQVSAPPVLGFHTLQAWEYNGGGAGTGRIFSAHGAGVALGGLQYRFKM